MRDDDSKINDNKKNNDDQTHSDTDTKPLSKAQKLSLLDDMINSYNNLPQSALAMPVNHYDFCSLLILMRSLFKEF